MVVFTDVDLEALVFGPMNTNNQGGKIVYINVEANSVKTNLNIQLCSKDLSDLQVAPFGISAPKDEAQTPGNKRTMDLTVNDEQKAFIENLENKILDIATERSVEWFGKECSRESVAAMFTSLLQRPNLEGQPWRVRTKVKMVCEDDDSDRNPKRRKIIPTNIAVVVSGSEDSSISYRKCTVDEVTKNSKCLAKVDLTSVYFINKRQFGISLNVSDVLVWPCVTTKDSFEIDFDLVQVD